MRDKNVWMCVYRAALDRQIPRKFVDIAWYLYIQYTTNNPITPTDKLLYGFASTAVISKFWEDDKYIIADDYCYAAGIYSKKGCKQVYRWFWNAEMKLLESVGFQLMKLSEEVLKNRLKS